MLYLHYLCLFSYSVMFLFCLSSFCIPYVASFSELSFFLFPLPVFSNVYSKDWGKPIILKSLRTSKSKDLNRMTKLLLRLVNYTRERLTLVLINYFNWELKINISNKPLQCESTDSWVNDTNGD